MDSESPDIQILPNTAPAEDILHMMSVTPENDRLTNDEFFGNFLFLLSGTPSVVFQLNLPASGNHTFAVRNESGQTATVKSGAGATADVSTGSLKLLHSDGSDIRTLAAP